jgi:hypothetical protein
MTPQRLDLAPIVTGHTWRGIPLIIRRDKPEGGEPAPPASPLASVEMVFQPTQECKAKGIITLSTTGPNPEIEILSAADWEFRVLPRLMTDFPPGRWNYILSTTATDGTRDPLLTGVLPVQPAP